MVQASSAVNKQTTAIGVTIRRVIVEQVVEERGVAIVRDAHQYMTEIRYRVQAGRGRMPRVGDYWYVDRSMGDWTFLAYIAKNDSDMTTFTEATNFDEAVTINGPLFVNNDLFSSASIQVVRAHFFDTVYAARVMDDGFDRFRFSTDGALEWGPGDVTQDVKLHRVGPHNLRTDARFESGTLHVDGAADTGALTVNGALTNNGALTVTGALTAGSVHITGAVEFLDMTVDGDLVVHETLTVDGAADVAHLTAHNGATIQVGAAITGNSSVTGDLTVTGDLGVNDINASGLLDVTGITTNTLTATGLITADSGITLPTGAWVKRGNLVGLTMQNGWTYHNLGFQDPSYAEFPDHTAGLFGVADAGTTTGGTTITTIPTAIRPANDHVFFCAADGTKTIQIVVQAGGAVKIQNASATPVWVSLGNCRWPMVGF